MSVPTFVVGTGRCGSTMLSNMLREHPKVLSLSEFFGMMSDFSMVRLPKMFAGGYLDGRAFWSFVSEITPFMSFQLKHRVEPPEVLYPCDSPSARYSRETGIPGIQVTTLPHLTPEQDSVFDELGYEVNGWPVATMGDHYRHLFDWLTDRFGKRLWVERSGGSVLIALADVIDTFPDARFIQLVRDGRDASLSMREHIGFRSGLVMNAIRECLGVHPIESPDRLRIDRVPPELRRCLPENFDAAAFRAFRIELPFCGAYWSQSIAHGLDVLASMPPDRLLTLRYEDFFTDPKHQLDRFAAFLGEDYIDKDWSARCAATVRQPRSTWRDLPKEEARALTEACRPGFELLAGAGIDYEV
jgi:hypothetical protein